MITLPRNNLGLAIMLTAILLVTVTPGLVAGWLVSLVAPWWVSVPCGALTSLVSLLLTVKFR